MTSVLMRAAGRVRRLIRPTETEKSYRRWVRDHGDQTLRLEYPLTRASLVFDVGGYHGDWCHEIHARYGCALHVFEPVPAFAQGIARRFHEVGAIHVHPFGLGADTREERMTIAADGSSIFRAGERTETIRIVRAAEFLERDAIGEIDLMKINIEGGEYELLPHLVASGWIQRIGNLQVQFHEFVPRARPRMDEIQRALAATHQLTWQYRFIWENWERRH